MEWPLQQGFGRAQFDDAPGVHDGHFVAQLADDTEVVADKDHGKRQPGPQVVEKGEHLGLDGDVEGGCGLIAK